MDPRESTNPPHTAAVQLVRDLAGITVLLLLASQVGASTAPAPDAAAQTKALSAADRPAADKERDAGRKPGEVIAFLGVEPGMNVMDLIAASGYYTEVLSVAVGPKGRVYAQNSAFVLQLRDGANDKAMTSRLANDRLPNVQRVDRALAEAALPAGSLDAAITALNFHDIYNSRGAGEAEQFLAQVYALLEPGGVLGLIDHSGDAGQDNEALHRIEEKLAIDSAEAAGFVVEATSDALRNPADDRTRNVFDPTLRGHTDRFVLRLRKPEVSK